MRQSSGIKHVQGWMDAGDEVIFEANALVCRCLVLTDEQYKSRRHRPWSNPIPGHDATRFPYAIRIAISGNYHALMQVREVSEPGTIVVPRISLRKGQS